MILHAFAEIERLVAECKQRVGNVEDEYNDIFIEFQPQDVCGRMIGRVVGPFPDMRRARLFLRGKYDRNRIRGATFWENPTPDRYNDGVLYAHPNAAFRVISAPEFMSRYLAQIMMIATTGLIGAVQGPDLPFTDLRGALEDGDD